MAFTADSADARALTYDKLARRNRVVGVLRWAVPALGVALTTGLVIEIILANIAADYGLSGITYEEGKVVIADPRYGGLTGDGTRYDVEGESAKVSMDEPDLIDLNIATITTLDEQQYQMIAKADFAHLDLGTKQVTVEGLMTTVDSEGVTGELYSSLIDWPSQKLTSEGPVRFNFEDGSSIASDALVYVADRGVWRFGASTYTNPGDEEQAAVEITSDKLTYRSNEGEAEFAGNAVVKQDDVTVWSETVLVHFGDDGTSSFDNVEALGGVKVVDPEQTATGDSGLYDPNTKILNLTGNVKVVSETGTITSTQLSVDMASNVTEFSTDGQGRVHGDFDPPDADRAQIDADRMINRENENRTEFIGDTIVRMAQQTVWAQRFIVHYADDESSEIRSYEMLGAVRIRNPDQTATGDRGVYDPVSRILRLTGNVKVTNESGTVNAPELRVNLATNVSEFSATNSGGRVSGVFTPDNKPETL